MEVTKPKLTITQAVKEMPVEESLILLAQICDRLKERIDLKQGPQGHRGERGEASTVPGPAGPPGRDGADGKDGADAFNHFRIEVTKGDEPSAQIVWSEDGFFQVLELCLPRGEKGDPSSVPGPTGPQGPKGDTGATGPQGERGIAGLQGSVGPTGLPGPQGERGIVGPKGDTGAVGPAATVDEIRVAFAEALRDPELNKLALAKLILAQAVARREERLLEQQGLNRVVPAATRVRMAIENVAQDAVVPEPEPTPPPVAAPVVQTPVAPAPEKKGWLQRIFG